MELSLTPDRLPDEEPETPENVQFVPDNAVSGTEGVCKESAESTGPANKPCCGPDIRKKQLHTIYLSLCYMSIGMVIGLQGPTFLDLIQILDTDIETGTVLFTAASVGYLCGSLVNGIIFDKFSKELILFGSTLLGGLFTLAIPWCAQLHLMVAFFSMRAGALAVLDTGGSAFIVKIWGKDVAPYMQAINFAYGFGGIISPFIAEPFLAPKEDSSTINSNGIPFLFNQSNLNTTSEYIITTQGLKNVTKNSTGLFLPNAETNVHIAFLIIALFTSLCAFLNLEMYFSSKAEGKGKAQLREAAVEVEEEIRHIPLTWPIHLMLLTLVEFFYFFFCCVQDSFASFIMTFVVTHLKWTKTQGTVRR